MDSVKPHVVCIPLPLQGHINPMLELAKLLHSRGFYITFVHTEFDFQRLTNSGGSDSLIGLDDFRFEKVPDGLPSTNPRGVDDLPDLCTSMPIECLKAFRNLIENLIASPDVPPISCIVSDGVMSFTLDVAEEFGLREFLFFTPSSCGMLGYLQFDELIKRGYVPLKDESYLTNGYLETPVNWIPGLKGIKLKHIPTFIRTTNPSDIMFNYNLQSIHNAFRSKGILLNTFNYLESEVLEVIRSTFQSSIYTIGPVSLFSQQSQQPKLDRIESNLWKEDARCLDWLNAKPSRSVIYVNFGSLTTLSTNQLNEFAWGLAKSNYNFLWVIRPDMVEGERSEITANEYVEEIKTRGLLLRGWCPQGKVLAHPAVSVFLTHCGWNSMLESISQGVPMICWPFFAEQQINCYYLCDKWGIGMEIDDVKREKVERLVRGVMEGEKGKEMKRMVMELKDKGLEAVRRGGSSFVDFDRFVGHVIGRPCCLA